MVSTVTVCVLSSCDNLICVLQHFLFRDTHARDGEVFRFAQLFPLVQFSSYRLGTVFTLCQKSYLAAQMNCQGWLSPVVIKIIHQTAVSLEGMYCFINL